MVMKYMTDVEFFLGVLSHFKAGNETNRALVQRGYLKNTGYGGSYKVLKPFAMKSKYGDIREYKPHE